MYDPTELSSELYNFELPQDARVYVWSLRLNSLRVPVLFLNLSALLLRTSNNDPVPLVSRNKCHAASLSALRSFPRPFSVQQRPSCIILPSRNARAFRRLEPVWIAKNLLLHSLVTILLVTLMTIQKLLQEYSVVIVVLGMWIWSSRLHCYTFFSC